MIGVWVTFITLISMDGCGTVGLTPPADFSGAPTAHTRALPRDINAAVNHGISKVGYAIVQRQESHGGRLLVCELVNVKGEPGWLRVEVPRGISPESNVTPARINLTARLGRFGNPEQENVLIRAVQDQLVTLRARGY